MCKTRCIEKHEAFEVFLDIYQPLVYCLEEFKYSTNWNQDSRRDAQSFFLALTRFPFIFSLVVTKEVLGYMKALSTKLQSSYVDIVKAYKDVSFVKETLQSARLDIDQFHSRVYVSTCFIAKKVDVDESLPRTTGRQKYRCNVPSTSMSEYFKRQLTAPALDYHISEQVFILIKSNPLSDHDPLALNSCSMCRNPSIN